MRTACITVQAVNTACTVIQAVVLMQISLCSPELLTFLFFHIPKNPRWRGRHFGFSGYVNLVISGVLILWYLGDSTEKVSFPILKWPRNIAKF